MNKRKSDDANVSNAPKRVDRASKLSRKLSRLGCSPDILIVTLPRKTLWKIVRKLDLPALCSLAASNKAWFMLFSHPDTAWWTRLIDISGTGKYSYTTAMKLKPTFSTLYYLSNWGASFCDQCGMYSGPCEEDTIPISVYNEVDGAYLCINPDCAKPLERREGNVDLAELFPQCINSSRKREKDHTWKTLKQELRYPNDTPVDSEYKFCRRCGILKLHERYNETDYCDGCCHLQINCDCVTCARCGKLPLECKCSMCDECGRCEGCKACRTAKKRTCKCVFCEDCNLLLKQCEC